MPYPGEEHARAEERQALEWLLYQRHSESLRLQLQAATAILKERTGWTENEATEQIAARVAADLKPQEPR